MTVTAVDLTQKTHAIPMQSLVALVNLSEKTETTYEKISHLFRLTHEYRSHPYYFDHDIPIEDAQKGAMFFKALEIKAEEAHRFVNVIQKCEFLNKTTDGFIRKITINKPNQPESIERIYINKQANGKMEVIFVQHNDKDLFACSNEIYMRFGEWRWKGTYLYGEEVNGKEKHQEFLETYKKMLQLMDDQVKFEEIHKGLKHLS